jgi:hypothetical protein
VNIIEEIEPIDDRHSAIHEAGHAVAAVAFHLGLQYVSIGDQRLSDGTHIGGDYKWAGVTQREVIGLGRGSIPLIALCLSGPVAEMKINPDALHPGVLTCDARQGFTFAGLATMQFDPATGGVDARNPLVQDMYRKGWDRAKSFVEERWATIEALADQLQVRRRMTGKEVEDFIKDLDAGDRGS